MRAVPSVPRNVTRIPTYSESTIPLRDVAGLGYDAPSSHSFEIAMSIRPALFLSFLLMAVFAAAQERPLATPESAPGSVPAELRVLLVGHDPAQPKVVFRQLAEERTFRLYRERTAAWEALLRYHFAHVTVVHGDDYRVEMSDDVDVTVFDCRPAQLAAARRVKDPETGATVHHRASYLPDSFDRPAVLIAENAPLIGEPIGLKLDWL